MIFSSRELQAFCSGDAVARDPGFALLVSFAFYDGPERGLALFPSGEGVRFAAIAESRSRLFRAFEFTVLDGDWWPRVRSLSQADTLEASGRVWVPAASDESLVALERAVLEAAAALQVVGVGKPYLDCLAVSLIAEKQSHEIGLTRGSVSCFDAVHRMIKQTLRGGTGRSGSALGQDNQSP